MNSALIYLVAFVVALGILITVHEFGHFWVARRLGVKVLRFSIGFGAPLWTRRSKSDQTEYVVAAIPLGGYVKMLDEREAEVPQEQRHLAFNNKPVSSRFAIVAAGPLFNFLFAIAAFWLMFVIGVPGQAPVVGYVEPGGRAERAGLAQDERILAVDGQAIHTWEQARLAIFDAALEREPLDLTVAATDGQRRTTQLDFSDLTEPMEPQSFGDQLGLSPWSPPAVVAGITPDSAAERAGLQPGDRVVRVDDTPVRHWSDWVLYVRERPQVDIEMQLERGGETLEMVIRPERREANGEAYGFVGVERAAIPEDMHASLRYGPLKALAAGVERTWDMSVLMLRVLGSILVGEAALSNISGPLTIAQYAGETASLGFVPFLTFLAVVSISLGVLNLLPIPILDGGHLMYYLIELFKGSPVSEQAQAAGQRIGILFLLMLMALAFYNDFVRLFS